MCGARWSGIIPRTMLSSPVEDEAASLMVESDPSEGIARRQTSVAVWKAVLSLPEHYREVVVLCDLQELSYADAAEAVGCAIGTIRSRLHRAHDMLSKKLQHSAAAGAGNGKSCGEVRIMTCREFKT